jgi:streptomycin 6-kinase
MREDSVELLHDADPHQRARWLAARTDLNATAIWEWGAAERVSNGLSCLPVADLRSYGEQSLAAADRIAAGYPGPP